MSKIAKNAFFLAMTLFVATLTGVIVSYSCIACFRLNQFRWAIRVINLLRAKASTLPNTTCCSPAVITKNLVSSLQEKRACLRCFSILVALLVILR